LDHRFSRSPSQHSDATPDPGSIPDHHLTAAPAPVDAPRSMEASRSAHALPKASAQPGFAAAMEDIRLMGPRHAAQPVQRETRAGRRWLAWVLPLSCVAAATAGAYWLGLVEWPFLPASRLDHVGAKAISLAHSRRGRDVAELADPGQLIAQDQKGLV